MAAPSGKGATETDTFVAANQPKTAPSKWKGFVNFLYDKESGRVLGRTGKSWLQITIFYLIFYGVLAAFFAVLLILFLQTLDKHEPKWQNQHGIIGDNPGMGFRPVPPDSGSTLIWVKPRTNLSAAYVKGLRDYLKPYEEGQQENEQMMQCRGAARPTQENKKACIFDVSAKVLGACGADGTDFGYNNGQPCVLLKLNKIYGWVPDLWEAPDNNDQSFGELASAYQAMNNKTLAYDNKVVYVTCNGEDAVDREHIGPIRINPEGFGTAYFPFTNAPGYVSPIVMVEFLNPAPGVLINVECKAWAKNIKHNRADRLGMVHFELLNDK